MGRLGWAAAATVVAALCVVGQVSSVGPVVVSVTPQHGLHLGDAVVVVLWAAALLLIQARASARHR